MKQLAYIKREHEQHWVGDGFPVRSIFSYQQQAEELSPFLLLDYAGPAHFPATDRRLGVGPHPHRGFETVTIVYRGGVAHRDSTGSGGSIGPGDVQWMTAAAGVIHEEYHSPDFAAQGGDFEMVQLWVNLPARDKMHAPRYQHLAAASIPELALPQQAGSVRVIAGHYGGQHGPAQTFSPIQLWDLRLNAGHRLSLLLTAGYTTALLVLHGAIGLDAQHTVRDAELAVLHRDGSELELEIQQDSSVLLLHGAPLNEPVAGYGPFVMNSREEIAQALDDYKHGRFGRLHSQTDQT